MTPKPNHTQQQSLEVPLAVLLPAAGNRGDWKPCFASQISELVVHVVDSCHCFGWAAAANEFIIIGPDWAVEVVVLGTSMHSCRTCRLLSRSHCHGVWCQHYCWQRHARFCTVMPCPHQGLAHAHLEAASRWIVCCRAFLTCLQGLGFCKSSASGWLTIMTARPGRLAGTVP